MYNVCQEKFEDTVTRSCRRRAVHTMVNRKRSKGQTMIHKTLYRKQKIEQHEPLLKTGG